MSISIIIPTFNRRIMLLECLESIKAQLYRPIEIVIVDDGSKDNTKDAVMEWVKGSEPAGLTILYKHGNRIGAAAARNLGKAAASGNYVLFLDSDDLLVPSALSRAVEIMNADPTCDLLQSEYIWYNEDEGTGYTFESRPFDRERWKDQRVRALEYNKDTSATLYRREYLSQFEWNAKLRMYDDMDFGFKVAIRAEPSKIRHLGGPLCIYRQHRGSRLTEEGKSADGYIELLNSMEDTLVTAGVTDPGSRRALAFWIFRLCLIGGVLNLDIVRRFSRTGQGRFASFLFLATYCIKKACGLGSARHVYFRLFPHPTRTGRRRLDSGALRALRAPSRQETSREL